MIEDRADYSPRAAIGLDQATARVLGRRLIQQDNAPVRPE
jgi:hypothetical protein